MPSSESDGFATHRLPRTLGRRGRTPPAAPAHRAAAVRGAGRLLLPRRRPGRLARLAPRAAEVRLRRRHLLLRPLRLRPRAELLRHAADAAAGLVLRRGPDRPRLPAVRGRALLAGRAPVGRRPAARVAPPPEGARRPGVE